MNTLFSKKKIQESYDALGGRIYDIRYTEEQNKKYKIILDRIPPRSDNLILDCGCGTGLFLEMIKVQSVGIDLSIILLEKALERNLLGNFNLVQADIEYLPFRNQVFNQIYSVTVFHNLKNPENGLNEIKRVSKKDSQIVVTGLKKAYSEKKFFLLLNKMGFTFDLISSDELIDFVAFVRKCSD